jgi:ABC-type antimicrobial peptide transport system permease subunit
LDPTQPLTHSLDLSDTVSTSLAPGRFQALVLGLFAALAVGLAGIGIYGVLSESVNERRREIGVRLAMGAQPSVVVREIVLRGLRVAVFGIVVGGVAALGMTRLLSTLLFGVGPRDPITFVAAPLFLLAVVLLSSWLPASRASRVDPVAALRE